MAASASATCTYCGAPNPEEMDHVPPKSIFPRPRPSNLIRVPCCSSCHDKYDKVDEYFRIAISGTEKAYETTAGKSVWSSVVRGLHRPESKRLLSEIRRSVSMVDLYSPAGIYLGRGTAFQPRLQDVQATATRVLRGLHAHHMGHSAWRDLEFECVCINGAPRELYAPGTPVRELIDGVLQGERRNLGGEVFSYWFRSTEEEPRASGWFFEFFSSTQFVGFVTPIGVGEAEPNEEVPR